VASASCRWDIDGYVDAEPPQQLSAMAKNDAAILRRIVPVIPSLRDDMTF
jgi:hypothetical protein